MEKILISACLLGAKVRYDGSFGKQKITEMEVTAALLTQFGVKVFSENQLEEANQFFEYY